MNDSGGPENARRAEPGDDQNQSAERREDGPRCAASVRPPAIPEHRKKRHGRGDSGALFRCAPPSACACCHLAAALRLPARLRSVASRDSALAISQAHRKSRKRCRRNADTRVRTQRFTLRICAQIPRAQTVNGTRCAQGLARACAPPCAALFGRRYGARGEGLVDQKRLHDFSWARFSDAHPRGSPVRRERGHRGGASEQEDRQAVQARLRGRPGRVSRAMP